MKLLLPFEPPASTLLPARFCAEPWPAPAIVAVATPPLTPSPTPSRSPIISTRCFTIEQPINLHVTGCPHSCAQHYIGDIGLLGTKVAGAEGYQVVVGGGSDQDRGLARELIPAIPFSELPPVMDQLFHAYSERRSADESFLEFSRRHSITELQSFCTVKEQV